MLAILLAFVLAPFVDWMRRWHLGRVPSVIIAVLLALGIIVSLAGVIGVQVAGLATDLPRYQATIKEKVGSIRAGTIGRLPAMLKESTRRSRKHRPKPPIRIPSRGRGRACATRAPRAGPAAGGGPRARGNTAPDRAEHRAAASETAHHHGHRFVVLVFILYSGRICAIA